MRIITEMELRDQFKIEEFTTFNLPEGTRLTPAASQFLSERRIKIIDSENTARITSSPKIGANETQQKIKKNETSGEKNSKAEYMTHLRGSTLVPKNHPRIKLRGKLDSLQALIISTVIDVEGQGYYELGRDLRDLLEYIRKIMAAEVKEQTVAELIIRGWSEKEIHEYSHHPKKHFGVGHLLPSPAQGKIMAELNIVRTQIREVELSALDAFYSPERVERPDIMQAVNRLSSLVYVFMIRFAAGEYKIGQ